MRGAILVAGLLVVLMCTLPTMQNAAVAGKNPEIKQYEQMLLIQVNTYRTANGLSALKFDPVLLKLAQQHSVAMFRLKQITHEDFAKRFAQSGSRKCVENVGWNYSTARQQFNAWHQSGSHDKNMLENGLNKVGIAEVGGYVTYFACQ